MELKRIICTANTQWSWFAREFGPDALVVSSHKVNRKFEMIVAVDITPDPSLIDQADELLIEVQGERETGTTLFRSIARRTKKRAGYDE